jgi:hypothetical protein
VPFLLLNLVDGSFNDNNTLPEASGGGRLILGDQQAQGHAGIIVVFSSKTENMRK